MLIREIEMKWQEIYEPNKKKVFDEIISDIKNIKSTQNKKCKKLLNEIEIFLKDNLAGLTKEKLDGVKGELDTLYKQVGESKKSKENKLQKILDDLVQDPDRKEPK
ncbi:hypothetical protein [Streptococcus saliviloxodontae]|nr:hypothetical protein [Streptococcus saliviloxodontae]